MISRSPPRRRNDWSADFSPLPADLAKPERGGLKSALLNSTAVGVRGEVEWQSGAMAWVRPGVAVHPTCMDRLIRGAESGIVSLVLALVALTGGVSNAAQPESSVSSNHQPGLVRSEFIFETAPFASSHASTIV